MVKLEDGSSAWYNVVIYGGKQLTGVDAIEWTRKMQDLGAGEILLTSKDRDRTKDGYDIPVTKTIAEIVDIPVITSGGVGTMEHIYEAFVNGADAGLASEHIPLRDVYRGQDRGVSVRERCGLKVPCSTPE